MKSSILSLVLLCCSLFAQAQIVYHNADQFPLYGKATEATATRYERFPDSLRNISRKPLWELSQNSAGLAIRFRTNSTTIAAKWELLLDRTMSHMTPVGIKGLDLYSLENGEWKFVNSGRPTGKSSQNTIISNMTPEMREYLLYLPLYDGVTALEIGIDSLALIDQPKVEMPTQNKPIVFYGTSILQGACASRPGMAHTNILSRWLNRECINLGFSGNGQLDLEVAEVIAGVDAGCFVLDFVPNASVDQMNEKAYQFYSIIRSKHPDTPIIFIEDPIFAHSYFDQRAARELSNKNKTINELFRTWKKQGEKNIYFISSQKMLGDDREATVDGIHFTDLGMMRYAELIYPVIKKNLKK